MADGKVVIKATLDGSDAQSGVSKLKGLLGGLQQTGSRVGSVFKSVLGANLVSSAFTSGLSAVSNGITGIIGNLNESTAAWSSFEGNMKNLGVADAEIKQVSASLQDYAKKTIYSSSEMASTYAQLRATGVEGTEELVKAFGNLAGSAENPAQAMKTLSQQATQMTANSKVQFADFRIMAQQAPSAMAEVAKKMGMTYGELTTAIKDGKVATTDFFEAVKQAGAAGSVFEDMATKPKSIAQAFDTLTDGISNKLLPRFKQFNQAGIDFISGISDAVENLDFDGIFVQFDGLVAGFRNLGVFDNFKVTLDSIGEAFKNAFRIDSADLNTGVVTVANILNGLMYVVQDIAFGISSFFQGFSNSGAIRALTLAFYDLSVAGLDLSEKLSGIIPWEKIGSAVGQVVKFLAEIVSAVAEFSQSIDGNIFRGLLIGIPAAIAGLKAFNFLKGFNPFNLFKKNAMDGVDGATNAVRRSKSTISQLFSGISNIIKSAGVAIKTAALGIGQGIKAALSGVAPVLKSFGAMLKTAGVANVLAFGGSVAIAAVGIGAGLAIISAGLALLATQGQGVATIIQAVGVAFGTVASMLIGAFAQAIVTVSGVLPVVASSLSLLSPLVLALGEAFASVIAAAGEAAPRFAILASAIGGSISQIIGAAAGLVGAFAPIAQVVSETFIRVTQIVAEAIVQIVRALAPFIPAVTEMVVALAPVLESMVEAFNNLISQIGPIIDSLTNLLETFGEQVRSILDGASGVVESFGSAIRDVLDGVAGIFESMGNAAKNAGQGVKLMAQGIKILVDLKLGDLTGTLAATAAGIGSMAAHADGMTTLGTAMTQVGTGMALFATGSVVAVTAMTTFGTAVTTLQGSLTQLPSLMMTAATGFSSFTARAVSGIAGLSSINAPIAMFRAQLMTISPALLSATIGFTGFSAGAMALGAGLGLLGGLIGALVSRLTAVYSGTISMSASFSVASLSASSMSSAIISGVSRATSAVTSGMSQMVSVIRSSAIQMTQAGRGISNGVTNGIRAGVGPATAAMSAMMTAIKSTAMASAGSMQYIGAMIGQGLAQGMYSALGSVTAAANALVAQAERAARAKAQIHSPARLFRDRVGIFIGQGVAVGIDKSAKYVDSAMGGIFDNIQNFEYKPKDVIGAWYANANRSLSLGVSAGATTTPVAQANQVANHQYTLNVNVSGGDIDNRDKMKRLFKEFAWYMQQEQGRLGGV